MKPISLNDEQRGIIIQDFLRYINNIRTNSEKIEYSVKLNKPLENNVVKPIIFFTKLATDKMTYLVDKCSKEVAWHGLVTKEDNVYVIEDILVYPQTVTGTTVTTDDEETAKWMNNLDDVTFNKLRLQGHSHVHMGTSPSSTDTTYYNSLLQNLSSEDYYIFMILNKKNSFFLNIYDYAQNVIFELDDITVQFEQGLDPLAEWYAKSMELVQEIKPKKESKKDYGYNGYVEDYKALGYETYTDYWRDKYGTRHY